MITIVSVLCFIAGILIGFLANMFQANKIFITLKNGTIIRAQANQYGVYHQINMPKVNEGKEEPISGGEQFKPKPW